MPRSSSLDRNSLRKLVETHLKALNAHDVDRLVSCYAPDAVLEFPASPPARGTERIRKGFSAFFAQWDESSEYRSIVIEGHTAAVEGTSVGRHRTLQLKIPGRVAAGGGQYRHDFAAFLKFRKDKIIHHRVYYDARELIKQLLGS